MEICNFQRCFCFIQFGFLNVSLFFCFLYIYSLSPPLVLFVYFCSYQLKCKAIILDCFESFDLDWTFQSKIRKIKQNWELSWESWMRFGYTHTYTRWRALSHISLCIILTLSLRRMIIRQLRCGKTLYVCVCVHLKYWPIWNGYQMIHKVRRINKSCP